MLTKLEGVIARRVLLNYWMDAEVARRQVPEPFEIVTRNGFAVAGICLIRLESLRPQGMPAAMGIACENMAHRIAVRYPAEENGARVMREGVYIWRRDTDSIVAARLGGLLFPGVQRDAEFRTAETDDLLQMNVLSADGGADVSFAAGYDADWKWTLLFPRFADVAQFFERDDCGASCALRSESLAGLGVDALRWEMSPVQMHNPRSAFFENEDSFPRGSVGFDCGVMMRGIPSRWHALSDVPELAGATSSRQLRS